MHIKLHSSLDIAVSQKLTQCLYVCSHRYAARSEGMAQSVKIADFQAVLLQEALEAVLHGARLQRQAAAENIGRSAAMRS